MSDPITLSVLGGVALTEGIKFLYGQAGEIIKRWRERPATDATGSKAVERTDVLLPEVFEGQLIEPEIHFDEVERLQPSLIELRGKLSNYNDGTLEITDRDKSLLKSINELREVLEAIYQQPITFKGEKRDPSVTRVTE